MAALINKFFKFLSSNKNIFSSEYEFIEINEQNIGDFHKPIKDFEIAMEHWYPYGNDYFKINHGENYFYFFQRIGEMRMNIILYKGEIIGTACGVLKKVNGELIWYICDLKIKKEHRGIRLPIQLLIKNMDKSKITDKAYGISMNSNSENKILELAQSIPFLNFKKIDNICIYALTYEQIIKVKLILDKIYSEISFINISYCKKLMFKQSNSEFKILHLNFKPINEKKVQVYSEPQPDYMHMFCILESNSINKILNNIDIMPSSTATLIANNMDSFSWDFLTTSEI